MLTPHSQYDRLHSVYISMNKYIRMYIHQCDRLHLNYTQMLSTYIRTYVCVHTYVCAIYTYVRMCTYVCMCNIYVRTLRTRIHTYVLTAYKQKIPTIQLEVDPPERNRYSTIRKHPYSGTPPQTVFTAHPEDNSQHVSF